MFKKRIVYIVTAALAAAALTGCSVMPESNNAGGNDSVSNENSTLNIEDLFPELVESTTSSEEERTHFDTVWDMFDYKDDKSEIEFMSFETDDGIQKLSISSFEEKLRDYGKKAEVREDGGLYAFDASGAAVAVVPNDDGSVDYQLCDGAVLGAALEDKYMQILRSKSAFFGLHLGTSTMLLEIQIPDLEKVETDIGNNSVKYVLERDDYRITAYTNAGECFWFILTVFNNEGSEGGASGSEETSSGTSPLTWEQPQQEKIPLTYEELGKINVGPNTIDFFQSYNAANRTYDLTESIDSIDKLDFILSKLTAVADEDEADGKENIQDEFMDYTNYYYKPETAEKLIRKYFSPSFKISSLDYTKSSLWDSNSGQLKVMQDFDRIMGGLSLEYCCYNESGYKAGDYYYVDFLPLAGYPNAMELYNSAGSVKTLSMSYISSEFFDIPRLRLKFKRFIRFNALGEPRDYYVCVGFAPVREKSERLKAAAGLFAAIEKGKEQMDEFQGNMYFEDGMGVISGNLGKRMYISYFCQYGSRNFTQGEAFVTFGTKGENDVISYEDWGNTVGCGYDDPDPSKWYTEDTKRVNIKDNLNGEMYEYNFFKSPDKNTESYTLNGKEISKNRFENAEVYTYFSQLNKDNYVAEYVNGFEEMTLGDLYDITGVIIG